MATETMPPLEGKKRRIAIMTSGGDAPGMNGAVRACVRMALAKGCEAYCVYEGYEGLVQGGDLIKKMAWEDVRGFLSEGGTLIGTARCMAFMERPGRLTAAKNMVLNGIDAIIICGGDGSLTGADKFRAEWPSLIEELVEKKEFTPEQVEPFRHLNIVGLVGSIDNDLSMTDATIGCYSSLTRICEAVDYIEATASSHQRAFVVEVMGRHCGWLALMAGIATGADFIFIPENPASDNWQDEMCAIVKKHRELGKRKTIVIVAEGAHDRNLNKITATQLKDLLAGDRLKLDTRITTLGHVQRGGQACAYDRMLSTLQGAEAVNAVLEATPETPSPVICIVENQIVRRPLLEAVAQTHQVAEAIKNKDFAKAMSFRDAEFAEYYAAYNITTSTNKSDLKLPEDKRMRIGIIHVGAPAGGMNAATRAAVAYCLARGHTPIALHNGFPGLCRHHDDEISSVREFDWLEAESWASKGGSDIGTNRNLPSDDYETVAFCLRKYNIQALFVVGGFEAFTAVSQLRKEREHYSAFKIPMVVLPATVSNNVPGTEYSIGSDTCLNSLIQYCDACRQSASSSRRRVFVIETQGGYSGYIATIAGLSIGAVAVYTPEEGINIKMLDKDIDHLRDTFARDKGQSRAGKIMLINEKASDCYTAEIIANIIRVEARGRFEARWAVPGHFQQGTIPSPMDRVRGCRFGVRSIQHLESFAGLSKDEIAEDQMSASVIGIRGAQVKFSPMEQVERFETDWKQRRPKVEYWRAYQEIVDTLSGRPKRSPRSDSISSTNGRVQ